MYRTKYLEKRDITEFNFEALEMQKLNTPTDLGHLESYRGHWSIMFILMVMVTKMLKSGSFFVFSADESKKASQNLCKIFKFT